MIYRLAIAAALGLAALTAPADAQVVQVLPSCGSASIPVGSGGRLYTDQTGSLCTAGAGGAAQAGSVSSGGTSGTQAQAVQGINGGVPQNVNLLATTTAGPTPVTTTASSVVGKASAGNLYGFSVTASGTAAYLAILNATAAPAAGAAITPLECIPVAVNSYVARRQDIPERYTSGIVAVVSSSCTTFTAVAPQVVSLIVQ